MRRFIMSGVLVALVAGGAGSALAEGKSGPNGHNDYGLCKAYFAGSDNGKAHKRDKGPFPGLVEKAGDADGDGTPGEVEDVAAYCANVTPGGK